MCDRRGEGIAGVLGDLLASGDDVLIACNEPQRWRRGLDSTLAGLARGRAAIASWELLSLMPSLATAYAHVFALDPPPVEDALAFVRGIPGTEFAHCAWGPGEEAVARASIEARRDIRASVAAVYRALRDAGPAELDDLEPALDSVAPRAECALALCVLLELGLVHLEQGTVRVADAQPTELERSIAYRGQVAALEAAAAALGLLPRLLQPDPSGRDHLGRG